jgi:hypothetical protein
MVTTSIQVALLGAIQGSSAHANCKGVKIYCTAAVELKMNNLGTTEMLCWLMVSTLKSLKVNMDYSRR